MRRGEKSLIMIKPKWGFGYKKHSDELIFPPGWETPDQIAILKKRRLFYEVKLYDWIVRHDIDGDKNIIKTIINRGVGYDRPFEIDELVIDIKIYTKKDEEEHVHFHAEDLVTHMSDKDIITPIVKKIL